MDPTPLHSVVFYGIASSLLEDVDSLFATAEDADDVLAQILCEEPQFEGQLWAARIEFEASAN
jgi:hypothetical protein